jgi:hypothetical protein
MIKVSIGEQIPGGLFGPADHRQFVWMGEAVTPRELSVQLQRRAVGQPAE